MIIQDVISHLESRVPLAYQESYDNCGLLCGDSRWELRGVLISLDVTEAVLEEAMQRGCNLVVAHHPTTPEPMVGLALFKG